MKITAYKHKICPSYKQFNSAKWIGRMAADELPNFKVGKICEEDEPYDQVNELWMWEVQFEQADEDGSIGAWDLDLLHLGYVIGSTRSGSIVQLSNGPHAGQIYDVPADIWERLSYDAFESSTPNAVHNQLTKHGAVYMARNFETFHTTYVLEQMVVEFTAIVGANEKRFGFGHGRYFGTTDAYDPQVFDLITRRRILMPEEEFEDVTMVNGQFYAASYNGQMFNEAGVPMNEEPDDITVNTFDWAHGELYGIDHCGCHIHRWLSEQGRWEHFISVEKCSYLYGIVALVDGLLLLGQKCHYELRGGLLTESALDGDFRFGLVDGERLVLTGQNGVFTGTLAGVEDTQFDNDGRLVGNLVCWNGHILAGFHDGILEVLTDDVVWFSDKGGRLHVVEDELYRLQNHRVWKWRGDAWERIKVIVE